MSRPHVILNSNGHSMKGRRAPPRACTRAELEIIHPGSNPGGGFGRVADLKQAFVCKKDEDVDTIRERSL